VLELGDSAVAARRGASQPRGASAATAATGDWTAGTAACAPSGGASGGLVGPRARESASLGRPPPPPPSSSSSSGGGVYCPWRSRGTDAYGAAKRSEWAKAWAAKLDNDPLFHEAALARTLPVLSAQADDVARFLRRDRAQPVPAAMLEAVQAARRRAEQAADDDERRSEVGANRGEGGERSRVFPQRWRGTLKQKDYFIVEGKLQVS